VLIWRGVKFFLEKFGFSFTYLRVWYDFSLRQRRVESGEKTRKKNKKRRKNAQKAEKLKKKRKNDPFLCIKTYKIARPIQMPRSMLK